MLRMPTVTEQNEDISHGQQIGKDQKGDHKRDENGYQFNNVGFNEDILIFADTPKGMQRLRIYGQVWTANQWEENV